jgi:hypothetical protein
MMKISYLLTFILVLSRSGLLGQIFVSEKRTSPSCAGDTLNEKKSTHLSWTSLASDILEYNMSSPGSGIS